jgi:hypothetical protein
MKRKLVAAFVAALLLWVSAAGAQTESSRQLFTQVDPILQGLSEITGWKIKRRVPADYISKEKLNQFIQQRIREVVKPEEIRIESIVLKMFGFLPDDYDLKSAMVDLMTEQAAAFYDYDRKRLYITESSSSFLEKRAALVHELAHALADQSFPLGKYLRKGPDNDDDATARQAVIEGQATWLMWAYVSKIGGGEAKVSEFIIDSMQGAAASAVNAQYPVFEKAPLYLRQSLVFPYMGGLAFQNAIFEKLGQAAFSEVFRRPPASTQQVIHPDEYLAHRTPSKVAAPPAPKGYRELAEGAVGELDFHILLEQYAGAGTAGRIAPNWRGGQFRLFESKKGRIPLLSFAVEWAGDDLAREFFGVYRQILAKKSKTFEVREDSPRRYSGVSDRGGFDLRLSGSVVTCVEGLQPATLH